MSGQDPEYLETLTNRLSQDWLLQKIGQVTAEDIIARREAFKPLFDDEILEARQQFESTLRDIGLTAGGAGGALESERADIIRGGAAGQLALLQQRIGSDISKLAMQDVKDDAERRIAGFERAMDIEKDIARTGRTDFEESLERAELARAVGERERTFEQDKIGAQQAFLQETDPVRETEDTLQLCRYAAAWYKNLSTSIYHAKRVGGITALSGFANQGGGISSLATAESLAKKKKTDIKDIEDLADKESEHSMARNVKLRSRAYA